MPRCHGGTAVEPHILRENKQVAELGDVGKVPSKLLTFHGLGPLAFVRSPDHFCDFLPGM